MLKNRKDVTRLFKLGELDHVELSTYLSEHFKSGTHENGENSVLFGENLSLVYYSENNDNRDKSEIKEIWVSSDFENKELDNLVHSVESALQDKSSKIISRRVLLSSAPLNGGWNQTPNFQIFPVPTGAVLPQPPFAFGEGIWPFILECTFAGSSSFGISRLRETRSFRECESFLNFLCIGGVRSSSGFARQEWGFPVGIDHSKNPDSVLFQTGYSLPQRYLESTSKDRFSDISAHKSIDFVPTKEYYSTTSRDIGAFQIFPDLSQEIYSAFLGLQPHQRRSLCLSSYWLGKAYELNTVSQSISFSALVTALEVLLENPGPQSKCETCSQPIRESVSARFKKFIDRYCPGVPDDTKNSFYTLRSKILHGGGLMNFDSGEYLFSPFTIQNDRFKRNLFLIAHIALVNWCLLKGRQSID